MLDKTTPEFYSTILQDKRGFNDATIMNVKGSMIYSKNKNQAPLYSVMKVHSLLLIHTTLVFKYNENTKAINANGEIGFGLRLDPCKSNDGR
jgi:hypothetical protein